MEPLIGISVISIIFLVVIYLEYYHRHYYGKCGCGGDVYGPRGKGPDAQCEECRSTYNSSFGTWTDEARLKAYKNRMEMKNET